MITNIKKLTLDEIKTACYCGYDLFVYCHLPFMFTLNGDLNVIDLDTACVKEVDISFINQLLEKYPQDTKLTVDVNGKVKKMLIIEEK